MSSSKLRGVLDERTSDQRRRRRSERRFEIIRSFGDFSRSGSARDFHFAQRENNNNENNKARKKGRYSREKRGVLREINRIFKSLSPLLSVFSWRGGRRSRRFFFEKKTLEAKKEERKRKRNIALYEKKDNTATTEQRQKSQHSSLVLYSSLVYVVYK